MKKILIVDDEPEIVELVRVRLEANNYEVITASDGRQAIEEARRVKPDLIIMDLMMPNLSGGEAVIRLKSDEATKQIPVIFLTAVISKKGPEKNKINVGGQFYRAIPKLFKPEILLSEIKEILGE